MNFKSVVALIMAAAVFFFGVFTATNNWRAFIDVHAILIVLGGTIAVAAIAFQIDRTFVMLKVFYNRVVRGHKVDYVELIREIMLISEAYRTGDPQLPSLVARSKDYFLKEAMGVLLDDFLTPEEMENVLRTRATTMFNRHQDDARRFKALGKFPPAMGLMGAVLGMIALLQNLGQPGAETSIGPAMAVALVATLYGIALANLVILPIAENLLDGSRETLAKNIIIVEGVKLISQKKNRILLAEELNSYLLPNERLDWKRLNLGPAT